MQQRKQKVILDTDIGSDIDDAVCLAYLLAHPDCELLGITTVSGEPEIRARMASAQCRVAGVEVPIFAGVEPPLLVAARQPRSPQGAALTRWPHHEDFPRGQAVAFLRDTIRAHPGEITLLAIGPLTNIALLFASDPEIPALLKEFVIMGGDFRSPPPPNWQGGRWEWNIYCDPHAAAIVFNSNARVRAVGVDITRQVVLDAADVRARFAQHKLLHPVLDFAEVWFSQAHATITFHDPLVATTLFNDDICAHATGTVRVDLSEGADHAVTHWTPDPAGRHSIATSVDVPLFFERYFEVFV